MLDGELIKVSLDDLVRANEKGEVKWRYAASSNHIAFASQRALYKGRLYILEASGRLTCWNARTDALIWFDNKAGNKLTPKI